MNLQKYILEAYIFKKVEPSRNELKHLWYINLGLNIDISDSVLHKNWTSQYKRRKIKILLH